MSVYTYVNISLPEAKRLADLHGIEFDLNACHRYCQKYIKLSSDNFQPIEEGQHLECFSVYIFVKYGRCFGGGVRVGVEKEIVKIFTEDERNLHTLIIDIRNKYIAHSVNNFEDHKVKVWLNPDDKGRKVNDVNIGSNYIAGFSPSLIDRLKNLIDKIIVWIDKENKYEQKRLTQIVSERYTLDHLYSLNTEYPEDIDYTKVRKTRKGP
jgi:hypothetical protein